MKYETTNLGIVLFDSEGIMEQHTVSSPPLPPKQAPPKIICNL